MLTNNVEETNKSGRNNASREVIDEKVTVSFLFMSSL